MTAGAFYRAIVALVLAIVTVTPATADEDTRNVAEVECKAVMRLNDRERENTIVFLHGYLAGKKGALVIDVAKLSAATDKFIDHCLDNPKDKAVEVMAHLRAVRSGASRGTCRPSLPLAGEIEIV